MTRTSPYPPTFTTTIGDGEDDKRVAPKARLAHVPGEKPLTVKSQILRFCSVLLVDIILPVAVYFILKIWLAPVCVVVGVVSSQMVELEDILRERKTK